VRGIYEVTIDLASASARTAPCRNVPLSYRHYGGARRVDSSRRDLIAKAAASLGAFTGTLPSAAAPGVKPVSAPTTRGQRRGSTANSNSVPVLDVTLPPFSCVGDGVTDDTAGMQAALNAFATASRSGQSVKVYVPSGTFLVSAMLEVLNARGGIIVGDGKLQTIIQGGPGTTGREAVLRLTNCQNVTCQDFTIRSQGGGPNGAAACWQSYGDANRPGFSPTANRCERVSTDSSKIGFATGNAGGRTIYPGNQSDQNNDNVKLIACTVLNATVAAVQVVGRNSLCHDLISCDFHSLAVGISMPAGGSFRMIGGSLNCGTWDLDVAGLFEHTCTIVGTYAESGAAFLRADGSLEQSLQATNFVLRAFGFDKKGGPQGGPQGPLAKLIDFTGTRALITLHGCELSSGAGVGELALFLKDSNPHAAPTSQIALHDCYLGADEFILDRFTLIDAFSRWTASGRPAPTETLLNGATVIQWSAGNAFSPTGTQYKQASMRGVRSIAGVGAKPGLNLCNVATLAGGKGPCLSVPFPGGAELDTNYSVVVTPTASTGKPAAHSWRVQSIDKSTTGFTITTEADPGAGNSVTFDWQLMRWG
jgi:hypothetical protein